MLVAARTAPQNSYRNPVERIMSVINIGLQAVGLMRQKLPDNFEQVIHGCNSMAEIRTAASKNSAFKEAFADSLSPALCVLHDVISRLALKDKPLQVLHPCTEDEIKALHDRILEVDPTVLPTESRKEDLKSHEQLKTFMAHCCVQRQYFFCIKKCGMEGCGICQPPRLPQEEFEKLSFFPDPTKKLGSDSYLEFKEVWGKSTTEKDRPSISTKKGKEKPKKPFLMTAETVCDLIVCGECLKPRCVNSIGKLTKNEYAVL